MGEGETAGSARQFADVIGRNLSEAIDEAGKGTTGSARADAGKRLLVAFSGGPDSTALLFALHMVAPQLQLSLRACHVNHGLRAAESDDDETFCRRVCERLEIEFVPYRLPLSSEGGSSPSEAELRNSRYDCLVDAARQFATDSIVLAHTLDDQVETVLFRLFRGTALSGLVGMAPLKRLDNGCLLLRPALSLTRNDCMRFLASLAVSAREDSSNADTRFTRNFIRRELVPLIEARFPGFRERIERFRSVASVEEDYMQAMAARELAQLEAAEPRYGNTAWSRDALAALHPAIRRRVVAEALSSRGVERTFERVEGILSMFDEGAQSGLSLDDRWDVRIDGRGNLCWFEKKAPHTARAVVTPVRVPGTTLVPAIGRALRVEELGQSAAAVSKFPHPHELEAVVDLSNVPMPLTLRQRREGDFIQPFGMNERVKLKKYLHTHKPGTDTPSLQDVLLVHDDEVLWVPGVGLSERLRVRDLASHRLVWLDLTNDVGIG